MPKRKFETVDDLRDSLELYFAQVEGVPTLGMMYMHLGISSRTAANYYKDDHEFSEVMQTARDRVEAMMADAMVNGKVKNIAGIIFYAKNAFSWRDQKSVEVRGTGPGGSIPLLAVPMESKSIEEWQESVRLEAEAGGRPALDGPGDGGVPKDDANGSSVTVRAELVDDGGTGRRTSKGKRRAATGRRKSKNPDKGNSGKGKSPAK